MSREPPVPKPKRIPRQLSKPEAATYEIEVSPAIRSLIADQSTRINAAGGHTSVDQVADVAINAMLDALEAGAATRNEFGTCLLCVEEAELIAGECVRCRERHPRAGGYNFGDVRSTGVGVHVGSSHRRGG